jgi:hypothetical protein
VIELTLEAQWRTARSVFEHGAIAAGALSGCLHAIRKDFDIVGTVVIALTAGLGGGLLRDMLVANGPALALRHPTLLLAAVLASGAGILLGSRTRHLSGFLWTLDALSIGLFTVVWDFRIARVKSINASGHKFGLTPLGCGWCVWRETFDLPKELIFSVDYLGGNMPTFALNFSRPGGRIIVQYYNFVRLGKEGYRKVHQTCAETNAPTPIAVVCDGACRSAPVCRRAQACNV